MAFDTLKLAQRLEEAGFPAKQAAATSFAIAEAMTELMANLVTKQDLAALRSELKADNTELRQEMRHQIAMLRADMAAMEQRITIRLGVMLGGAIAAMAALSKIL